MVVVLRRAGVVRMELEIVRKVAAVGRKGIVRMVAVVHMAVAGHMEADVHREVADRRARSRGHGLDRRGRVRTCYQGTGWVAHIQHRHGFD